MTRKERCLLYGMWAIISVMCLFETWLLLKAWWIHSPQLGDRALWFMWTGYWVTSGFPRKEEGEAR